MKKCEMAWVWRNNVLIEFMIEINMIVILSNVNWKTFFKKIAAHIKKNPGLLNAHRVYQNNHV